VKAVRFLFLGHLMALAFGLIGLLIMVPHPEIWAHSANGQQVYNFGIKYAGSLHILLGATTMLVFGLRYVDRRKTLTFFGVTTALSLSIELVGTGTGWPFGPYAYTDGLGYKVLGRVPYSIPLSWFYMGFTAYVLASIIVQTRQIRWPAFTSVALGAWLLTAWDLVLDPAMASKSLTLHFWMWPNSGPYFGMPVSNFIGWSFTGLAFMSIARLLWRSGLEPRRIPAWLPFCVYAANMGFAIVISLNVGLWAPPLAALLLGLAPASLAWKRPKTDRGEPRPDRIGHPGRVSSAPTT